MRPEDQENLKKVLGAIASAFNEGHPFLVAIINHEEEANEVFTSDPEDMPELVRISARCAADMLLPDDSDLEGKDPRTLHDIQEAINGSKYGPH